LTNICLDTNIAITHQTAGSAPADEPQRAAAAERARSTVPARRGAPAKGHDLAMIHNDDIIASEMRLDAGLKWRRLPRLPKRCREDGLSA